MTAKLKLGLGSLAVVFAMISSATLTPAQPSTLVWKVQRVKPAVTASAPETVSREQTALAQHLASKYERPLSMVTRIVRAAYQEAATIGLPPLLVLAIIEKESALKPNAVNPSGAVGLMQVVPKYHADQLHQVMHPDGLRNPETNIRIGSRILAKFVELRNGNIDQALKAYSGNSRDYPRRVKAFKHELEEVRSQVVVGDVTPQM
jgi:soluble lytic murein transglycosylase-like protein